jgi:hypothetical protein
MIIDIDIIFVVFSPLLYLIAISRAHTCHTRPYPILDKPITLDCWLNQVLPHHLVAKKAFNFLTTLQLPR